jgi:hypothetical protein
MKHARWFILAAPIIGGCTTEPAQRSLPTFALAPTYWTVATPSDRAAAMTSDEAKAVLVARGYIEELARKQAADAKIPADQPQFLDFQPRQSAQGWDVYVEFVGEWVNDKPTRSVGHTTLVRIDRRWKVIDYHLSDGPPPASQPATSQPVQ